MVVVILMNNEIAKERVRKRVQLQMNEGKYEYYPETISRDHYDNEQYQRVGIYARVSTDDVRQTTSFELQKKYYEDFVRQHPRWELVDIYADEGISGTSTQHRVNFLRMLDDAKAGRLDLIITKSISRFARNVELCLKTLRTLSEHNPPIAVFFESENIYSLSEGSQMSLSFQAAMAEEESRTKRRSMETSLRMRLDHGLPLTPKLLGFTHNEDGKLVVDPETYRIPKLMFYMYLFGYSTQQIAETLNALGKKSRRGNTKWTSGSIIQTLRNERYCGDVFTRKTFTTDLISHRVAKNRGERPRTHYYDEHESIVSRDDYIAVQHLLNNEKYRNQSILPTLRVIREGLLKGYVVVNPRWGGFSETDYVLASASIPRDPAEADLSVEVSPGDFDFRGYEIADLGTGKTMPFLSMDMSALVFSAQCLHRMNKAKYVELLVHPIERRLAIRPTAEDNRNRIPWILPSSRRASTKKVPCAAFIDNIFTLFEWNHSYRYKMTGTLLEDQGESVMFFAAKDASILIRESTLPKTSRTSGESLARSRNHVVGFQQDVIDSFGKGFYLQQSMTDLLQSTRAQWQLRIQSQLSSVTQALSITPYDELKAFIEEEVGDLLLPEVKKQ